MKTYNIAHNLATLAYPLTLCGLNMSFLVFVVFRPLWRHELLSACSDDDVGHRNEEGIQQIFKIF